MSDPERYRSLHAVADRLVADLERRFVVERHDGTDLDEHLARMWPDSRTVHLTPDGGGAPLTMAAFTAFPGVGVVSGWAACSMFPSCGCDACNDDPDEEAGRLVDRVARVVAGGLTERRVRRLARLGRDRFAVTWTGTSGHSTSEGTIEEGEIENRIPVGVTSWPPWTLRPS